MDGDEGKSGTRIAGDRQETGHPNHPNPETGGITKLISTVRGDSSPPSIQKSAPDDAGLLPSRLLGVFRMTKEKLMGVEKGISNQEKAAG
jgi:hypothetical protein